jgi:hypothetical protein
MWYAWIQAEEYTSYMNEHAGQWSSATQIPIDWQAKPYGSISIITAQGAQGSADCESYYNGMAKTLTSQQWMGTVKGYCVDDCSQVSTKKSGNKPKTIDAVAPVLQPYTMTVTSSQVGGGDSIAMVCGVYNQDSMSYVDRL